MVAIIFLGSVGGCVDAIDQRSSECEAIMLPRILAKANTMPRDDILTAKGAQVEHFFKGGERRLRAVQAKITPDWQQTRVEPVDEINYGLWLHEDAVGFKRRAASRTKQLCKFAETNRILYESWWLSASEIADYTAQNRPVEAWN
jgi:hypothetical protein